MQFDRGLLRSSMAKKKRTLPISETCLDQPLSEARETALKAAIALLGSAGSPSMDSAQGWKARTSPRAQERVQLNRHPVEAGICLDLARTYVRSIASDRKAPRIKKTLQTFKEISQASEKLAVKLSSLTAEEAFWLNTVYGVPSNVFSRLGKLGASLPCLPEGGDEDKLAKILKTLSEYVELRRERLLRRLTKVGGGRPDPGGVANNIWRRLLGSPQDILVREAWTVFRRFKDLEPSSSEDGALNTFLGLIHTLATGRPAKTFHREIMRHVKALAHDPPFRAF
jgi:hypothetical protein